MKKMVTAITVLFLVLLSLNGFAGYGRNVVRDFRTMLAQEGFSPESANKLSDPNTKKTILEFQGKSGIEPAGTLDNATLVALKRREAADNPPWAMEGASENGAYRLAKISDVGEAKDVNASAKKVSVTERFAQEFKTMIGSKSLAAAWFVGLLVAILFWRKKRLVERKDIRKGAGYFFYLFSLEFLVPFTIILGAYYAFCGALWFMIDSVNLGALVKLEEALEKARSMFSVFKVSAFQTFGVLVILYLLNFVRVPSSNISTLFKFFDRYQKFVRRAYIVAVLLASFTLLGSQIGNPTSALKVKIRTTRDGYADLVNDTAELLSQVVFHDLFEKAKKDFPESYIEAFDLPGKILADAESLKKYYEKVSDKYSFKDDSVVMLYSKYIGRSHLKGYSEILSLDFDRISVSRSEVSKENKEHIRKNVEARSGDINLVVLDEEAATKRIVPTQYPETLTQKQIESTKKAISNYKQKIPARAVELLQLPGGKKILLHGPRLITAQLKTAVFGELIRNIPLFGPLVDVASNTIGKAVEVKFGESAENALAISGKDSGRLGSALRSESSKIVQATDIFLTKDQLRFARIEPARLKAEVQHFKEKDMLLQSKAQQLQVERLIAGLKSKSDDDFFDARKQIINLKNKISAEKIHEVDSITKDRILSIIDKLDKSEGAQYDAEYNRLKRYNPLLSHQQRARIKSIENKKFDAVIEDLASENKKVREKASAKLNKMAPHLSKSQVNRIIGMLDSNKTFREYLYRESHCTWYEYITQKYYAGQILSQMDSPYVNAAIKQRARGAVSGGKTKKRVTDPGWI
jgi:hypothetical protein